MIDELAKLGLFSLLSPDVLASLRDEIALVGVPGGHTLFAKGDDADGLYIVLRGRLRSLSDDGRVLGEVHSGGYVGEMALLSGSKRSATVVAVRDSTLARLSRKGFDSMVASCPATTAAIARTVAARAQSNVSAALRTDPFSTVCMFTNASDAAAQAFERRFLAELAAIGATIDVGADALPSSRWNGGATGDVTETRAWRIVDTTSRLAMRAEDAAWFDALESRARFIVYRCNLDTPEWTGLCLRRADLVLVAIRPHEIASLVSAVAAAPAANLAGIDVVVLHDGPVRIPPELRASAKFRHVHHVRTGRDADAARTVRVLTGRATGLALSGGNRRGAAHVGALRAMQESGLAVDVVAGTSAGAIVGAMAALEMDWREALEHVHLLARMPAWRDVGPPIVALLSGRSLSSTLHRIFGDTLLDETPLPLLAVCSAVESGDVFVPEGGPLWLALRASASLPGIFPPVPWQRRLLMDGALVNNLPVDLLRMRCPRGRVLACDVGLPTLRTDFPEELHSTSGWKLLMSRWRADGAEPRASLVDLLTSAACAASTRHFSSIREGIDCYIAPPIADHAMLSRRRGHDIDVMMQRGYEAALRALEEAAQADAT